jgi:RNA-binding protein NOB1
MAISYSSAVQAVNAEAGPSTSTAQPPSTNGSGGSTSSASQGTTRHLILDAGPLLALTPVRELGEFLHTTPLVLAELRDPKSREYWEQLKTTGVEIKVEMPTAESMARGQSFILRRFPL